MKVAVFLILGLHFFANSLQKPEPSVIGRQPKSLRDIALEKNLKSITSKAQLEQLLSKLPVDMHCDAIKKSIRNKYLSQIDLLDLIKKYCSNNALLRAYTYYTHITGQNFKRNIFLMDALSGHEKVSGNSASVQIIEALILSATHPNLGFSPIHMLIEFHRFGTDTISYIKLLLEMGEKPRLNDLTYAISQRETPIALLLIEHGVEVENDKTEISEQPLFQAFQTLNELVIRTLLQNGASNQRQYNSAQENKKITIPEYMRLFIDNVQRSGQPIEGESQEQTNKYISQLKKLLDTYVPNEKI